MKPKPCATCPWRKGASAATMPGGFDVEWARSLRAAFRESALGTPILTCHHRDFDMASVCAGFLNDQAREGVPNLMVRLALMRGELELPKKPDPDLLSYEALIEQMENDPTAIGKGSVEPGDE